MKNEPTDRITPKKIEKYTSLTSNASVNNGVFRHVIGVWDNSKMYIYIDGNLDISGDKVGGSLPNTTDRFGLGAELSPTVAGTFFNGIISEGYVWARSLRQPEISNLYLTAKRRMPWS